MWGDALALGLAMVAASWLTPHPPHVAPAVHASHGFPPVLPWMVASGITVLFLSPKRQMPIDTTSSNKQVTENKKSEEFSIHKTNRPLFETKHYNEAQQRIFHNWDKELESRERYVHCISQCH